MATRVADNQVEGINPVFEALRGRRRVREVIFLAGHADRHQMSRIESSAGIKSVPVRELPKDLFLAQTSIDSHQGVLARTDPYPYVEVADILSFRDAREIPLMLALDHITDAHNFGAIIRNCEAAGVSACIVAKRNAPPITPAVAKASAGAVEHVSICRVANLVNTMRKLKRHGLWFVGAASEATTDYRDFDLTGPVALVLGAEGKGLSRLVKEECDHLISIPMAGEIESLNVSAASAVLLFEARRQRDRREDGKSKCD